ncbi:MAG: Holliday junction resolvase RuvX [Propionibacteriaceae bacterium]
MRLALDWGEARIGVAACDREGILAYPVQTVAAGPQAVTQLCAIIAEYEPVLIYVGLPRSLRGATEIAATKVMGYARDFAAQIALPIYLIDERMTTVSAAKQLRQTGKNAKHQRSIIDQAAAVAILNHALDIERHGGDVAGTLLLAEEEGAP